MEKSNRVFKILRASIMGLILLLTLTLGQLHQINKVFLPIDAFCPFGGLESLYAVFKYGMFLQRVAWGSLILLAATIIVSIFFRRSFCGYICPLGTIQEFFGWGGRKIMKKRFVVPKKADRILRYLKYVILVLILALTYWTGQLIIRPYDPWAALHHINSVEVFQKFLIGFIILMISLIGSFFFDRFFCKYLCPMGAFLGILSKLGIYRVKRDEDKCIDCGICSEKCPVNIPVDELEQVKSAECISCNLCVANCPEKGALKVTSKKGKRGVSLHAIIAIVLIIFIVLTAATMSIGMFKISKIPNGFPTKAYSLYFGTRFIDGDNSLLEVCYVYGISPDFFVNQFGFTEEDFYKPLTELPITTEEIRELADYVVAYSKENHRCDN